MLKIFQTATRPGGMIAWNPFGKGVLLITPNYFRALVDELLSDQGDDVRRSTFYFRICHHMKMGTEQDNDHLQQILQKRLLLRLDQEPLPIFSYTFHEHDAREYVEDFLEAFKFNEVKIGYAIGRLDDGSDEVINISLRAPPTLLQKLRGRLGSPKSEINILRNQIMELSGTPSRFVVQLRSGMAYSFSEAGVHKSAADHSG